MSFETLGLGPKLLQSIEESGYTEPTPIQKEAIPQILEGHDLTGIAQTGTGRPPHSPCPCCKPSSVSTAKEGDIARTRALVISPTRELVVQIHDNVNAYAKHLPLKVATVYGGVGEGPQKQALRNGYELVIATPGRLMDLMDQGCADFPGLEYLVLDEADRMLDTWASSPTSAGSSRICPRKAGKPYFSPRLFPAPSRSSPRSFSSSRERWRSEGVRIRRTPLNKSFTKCPSPRRFISSSTFFRTTICTPCWSSLGPSTERTKQLPIGPFPDSLRCDSLQPQPKPKSTRPAGF